MVIDRVSERRNPSVRIATCDFLQGPHFDDMVSLVYKTAVSSDVFDPGIVPRSCAAK
jgi:hypothetical protein